MAWHTNVSLYFIFALSPAIYLHSAYVFVSHFSTGAAAFFCVCLLFFPLFLSISKYIHTKHKFSASSLKSHRLTRFLFFPLTYAYAHTHTHYTKKTSQKKKQKNKRMPWLNRNVHCQLSYRWNASNIACSSFPSQKWK